MGPIFIILGPMGGIHIPADGLPRDYELLRGNGVSDASRRHRHSLLGIIFVILNNNIIFCNLFGCIMVTNNPYTEEEQEQLERELHDIIQRAEYDIKCAIAELESMQKTHYVIPYFLGVQWND